VPERVNAITVFVSYRCVDSESAAGRLYDFLEQDGRFKVLFDVASIEAGTDYREAVAEQIEGSDVVLAVIGREWLTLRGRGGERRLDDASDPVRLEIETALAAGKILIPVFVDAAEAPDEADMPESIQSLARRSGMEVRHESFRDDARRLADALSRSVVRLESAPGEGLPSSMVSDAAPQSEAVGGNTAPVYESAPLGEAEPLSQESTRAPQSPSAGRK